MSKRRTQASEIKNPERYFAKWLSCEKKNFYKKKGLIDDNEDSFDDICETKSGKAMLAINLNGELFAQVENSHSEFAWIEQIENDLLYEFISKLSHFEKLVLTLRIQNKCSFDEIGSQLGISQNTANVKYFRIIKKINNFFERCKKNNIFIPIYFEGQKKSHQSVL